MKERRRHGTREFPLQVYNPQGLTAPYHWHDEYEFIYMNSGTAFCRLGAELFELHEGECAFVKGGVLHSLYVDDIVSFNFHAIVFHPSWILGSIDVCDKYLSSRYRIKQILSPDNAAERTVIEVVRQLRDTCEGKAFAYEIKVKSLLLSIFSLIFENNLYEVETSTEKNLAVEKLEKVISYIHENYGRRLTVEELSGEAGYSASHFGRFFKEITGKTPVEYVNRYRVYIACRRLKDSEAGVIDTALECGFENIGHFIRTFKRYTGCTPYQYKMDQRQR